MRAILCLVASTFVLSSEGYYPYDFYRGGCSNCQRPPQCPPCPATPACSSALAAANLQHISSDSSDCGSPTCSEQKYQRGAGQKLPDLGVNEGAINRKYPQARVLDTDEGNAPQNVEDEVIEEEVTSEAPFHEPSPPTPPPAFEPANVLEASSEASRLPPYLSKILTGVKTSVHRRVARKAPFKCNDERLRIIMHQSMDANDLTQSKRMIVAEAEKVLFGRFNVICSPTRLSYVANTRKYCEVTLPEIVCLAFMH